MSSDIVRKNIEILKVLLNRISRLYEDPYGADKTSKSVLVFMHRMRGEIRFFDPYSEPIDPKEWTCLRFCFFPSLSLSESFSVDISNVEEKYFSWEDLDPTAFSALKETLKTVQFLSKFYPKLSNIATTLKEFSLANLDLLLGRFTQKDIIHEAWHDLSREQIEKLLWAHPKGTFVFRKDFFTSILEEELSRAHRKKILCITLSFVCARRHLREKTLVKTSQGWMVYNDDPNLRDCFYPSIYSLLDSLRSEIVSPLLTQYNG